MSFDKYYDKLDLVNKKFDSWRIEILRTQPELLQDHLYTMFVFAELDNLEYVLEKYKLGYVKQEFMDRALRTIIARCEEEQIYIGAKVECFRHRAKNLMKMAKGYEDTTRRIIDEICQSCDD